jgi:hypothetical protein
MTPLPPPLSVVVATTQPWPELRAVLESLAPQAEALGAEIIVADGHGRGLPDEHGFGHIRVVRRPGASVYQLRALAFAESRADVVAVTEDHCVVAADWCEQVLRAHRAYPRAAAIGGIVYNGASDSLWDWANFLISNGPLLPPLPVGERDDIAGQANLSYKRWALPSSVPPHGYEEPEHKRALRAAGHTLVTDDRMVTFHVQSLGRLGSCLVHYHNARASTGFASLHFTRAQRLAHAVRRLLLPVRVAVDSTRIVARTVVRKPAYRRVAVLAWPLVTLMLCFHVAGELVGYARGPGSSPGRVR